MESLGKPQKRVLIAEDDLDDIKLMAQIFSHPPGWEVPDLAPIPVVIWSVSDSAEDIAFAYKHGAAAYFSKRADTQELLAQARTIREFYDEAQLYSPEDDC